MAKDVGLENMCDFARKGARTEPRGYISTGHFDLDYAIVNGTTPGNVNLDKLEYDPNEIGIPRGIILQIFGDEGGGKSSEAYRICGIAQKQDLKCLWVDAEFSFSLDLAEINGVDTDELFIMDSDVFKGVDGGMTGERVFDKIYKGLNQGIDVVVVDSVASLVPQAIMQKTTEENTMAELARLMSKACPKLVQLVADKNALVIFLNQCREKPGVMYGDPTTRPGGKALNYYCSLMLQMRKRTSEDSMVYIEDDDGHQQLIAQTARVTIKKNRFAPFMKDPIDIPIYFQPYFLNPEEKAFELGRKLKLISVREGVFKWTDLRVEGKKAFIDALKEKGLTFNLIEAIKTKAKEDGVVLPPEVMNYETVEDGSVNTAASIKDAEHGDDDDGSSGNEKKVQRGRKKKDSGLSTEMPLE